ncbi:MAG TPA: hypothetical protein VJO99_01035 [Burkholderiaceae bacterium]|nr:hypothetical protein [Burkholderiaceae bacterium]
MDDTTLSLPFSASTEPPRTDRRRLSKPQMRRRFRLWMTGSLAVVMAALLPSRAPAETERSETHRVLRHSRYGVVETVQRIEAAALSQGMAVLARVSASGQPVIVLESSIGGTLVVMDEASERVDIPFSLQVRESADGGADVLLAVPADAATGEWQDVPDRVVADLRLLPELVELAVGET